MRRAMLMVVALLSAMTVFAPVNPAQAYHGSSFHSHWGPYNWAPGVWSYYPGWQQADLDSLVGDGFVNGFSVNGYGDGCSTPGEGSINICWTYPGDPVLCGDGCAYGNSSDIPGNGYHMRSCHIFIRNDLDDYASHLVAKHEIGHCLGFDHNNNPGSFMHGVVTSYYADQHDRDDFYYWYVQHQYP